MKRYESHRILGLSAKMNGSSILFINVYFSVACHEKYEVYIMCLGILSSILESHEDGWFEISRSNTLMFAYWETLMQHLVLRDLMKFVTYCMRIM